MGKNLKKNIVFLFFLLAGITLGAFISYICDGKAYVDWLSWGKSFGFGSDGSVVLDLSVIKIMLGLTFTVTIAQLFTVTATIIAYSKIAKHL